MNQFPPLLPEQKRPRGTRRSKNHGMALISGLVLLLVLSIVAIAAMQLTSLEYEMSANSVNQSQARQVSESARMSVSSVLPEHTYRRGWSGITKADGLTIKDKDASGSEDKLYGSNSESCAEGCFDHDTLDEDATFAIDMDNADADGDGNDSNDPLDLSASIAVYRSNTQLDKGAGAAMIAGYMGLGKGAAGGGAVVHFYVRSDGEAARNARHTTSSDVKSRVFN